MPLSLVTYLEPARVWLAGLAAAYGVDPVVFGALYVGATPLFVLTAAWTVRNHRQGQPIVLPGVLCAISFAAAYVYVLVAGQNIPWWVYAAVVGLLGGGGWSTLRMIRARLQAAD